MKIIAKFLLIYCIIAVIGHDVMTQDDPPKDEFNIGEFNRWYRESQEKDFLERQRSMQAFRDNLRLAIDPNVGPHYKIQMNRPEKYKLGEPVFVRDYLEKPGKWIWFSIDPSWHHLFASRRVCLVDPMETKFR